MTTTDAIDIINGVIQSAWVAKSTGTIKWPDGDMGVPTDPEWARVKIQHADGGLSSLAGETNVKKYTELGIVYIQIFTKLNAKNLRGYELGSAILDAFRKAKISGMVFRNYRRREIGPDGAFFQIQAIVGFEYEIHV